MTCMSDISVLSQSLFGLTAALLVPRVDTWSDKRYHIDVSCLHAAWSPILDFAST